MTARAQGLGTLPVEVAPEEHIATSSVSSWSRSSSTAQDMTPSVSLGSYDELIENLHGRLDRITEKIALADDKVSLLREVALGAKFGETRVMISHRNELGDGYFLEEARYLLDGGVLLQEADVNGSLSSVESRVLFDGKLAPGSHEIEVDIICRSGGFGLFSYLKAYRFRVSSKYVLRVREGRINRLDIIAYDKNDITVQAGERLSVRYNFETFDELKKSTENTP